LMCEPRESIEL